VNDGELTCQEMVELVTDYLDGAMAPALRARFEAHLAGCEGCAAYLDQLRTTIRLAGELPRLAVPDPALEALVDAFRDWRGRPLPGS
jgi:anti-sigma factor RsiW